MPNVPQTSEIPGQNPDPVKLLNDLESMDTDQKKYNHLRTLFIEEADVDEYMQYLDADGDIDLTKPQITQLKATLAGYRVYLKDYIERTGERIGRFDEKLKKSGEEIINSELTQEEADKIAHTRKRVAKAMQIANAPRGVKGKSLREAAGKTGEAPIAGPLEDKTEAEYAEFIDGLHLTTEQKEKLNLVVAGYDEAVATAKELDPNVQAPSKEQVIAHILALGAGKLEKIAAIMSKPALIIEPDKSFVEMKNAMNNNRHYDNQNYAYFASDYEWSRRPKKVSVSIMDMIQYPAVVPGQKPREQRNDEQLRICEKYFRDDGMRLATDRQFAAGLQQSLRAYEQAKKKGEPNPEKYILDFYDFDYDQPQETVTIFNQEHNPVISKVAFGLFHLVRRLVYFSWFPPGGKFSVLRGRGAVQVM